MPLNIFYEVQELGKLQDVRFDWKKKSKNMNIKAHLKNIFSLFSRSYKCIKQYQSFYPFPVCCIKVTHTFSGWKSPFSLAKLV